MAEGGSFFLQSHDLQLKLSYLLASLAKHPLSLPQILLIATLPLFIKAFALLELLSHDEELTLAVLQLFLHIVDALVSLFELIVE